MNNVAITRTIIMMVMGHIFFALSAMPITISLIDIWYHNVSFWHGFLVIPFFYVGLFLKKDIIANYPIRFEPLAVPLCAVIFTVMMLFYYAGLNIIAHFLYVISLMLIVFVALGRHICKRIISLIIFLGFALPFGTELIVPLQNFTANLSVAMLKLTGIDVLHEGIYIITDRARFYVAEACAGLRFLTANLFVCYIFAFFYFNKIRSWLVFAIISFVIPIIGNCFRAYLIMVIGHYSDGELAAGVDHYLYGWGFFTVLSFINFVIGDKIAKYEGIIETPYEAPLPFGHYDATRDRFYSFYHFYERRIFLSFFMILLLPFCIAKYLDMVLAFSKEHIVPEFNLISPIKVDYSQDKKVKPIYSFDDADLETAYITRHNNQEIYLQISYYKYQSADKESTTAKNRVYDEDKRFLLSRQNVEFANKQFTAFTTGRLDSNKQTTLMSYFYKYNNDYVITNNRIEAQFFSFWNLLINAENAGGLIVVDKGKT